MLRVVRPPGRPERAVRRRDAARRLPAARGDPGRHPRHPAVNIRKFVARASDVDELVRLGMVTAQRGPLPRRGRGGRAERARQRRHPGRQDDAARLPGGACRPGSGWSRCEEVFELRPPLPDGWRCRPASRTSRAPARSPCAGWSRRRCGCGPTALVVGEVRQEECLDLLIAMNSGVPGMCTLHANSAREALHQMCTLPLLAGGNIAAEFVVPTVAGCVDLVVHLGDRPARAAPGAGDPRRARPGRGRRHRDRRAVRHGGRPARPRRRPPTARRALRPARPRPRRPARRWAEWARCWGCCSGRAVCWWSGAHGAGWRGPAGGRRLVAGPGGAAAPGRPAGAVRPPTCCWPSC